MREGAVLPNEAMKLTKAALSSVGAVFAAYRWCSPDIQRGAR